MACQPSAAPDARPATASQAAGVRDIDLNRFQIRTNPWVSLHFFAFHAARAQSGKDYGYTNVQLLPRDLELLRDPAIASAFEPVAELYGPFLDNRLSRGALFSVARALGEGPETIEDEETRQVFENFMPVYLEHFWPRHRPLAEELANKLRADLNVHGAAVLAATADELDATWGESTYTTYVSAYGNWAGAFSDDNVIFLSATDPELPAHLLEIFVHEAAHGEPIGNTIRPAAEAALAANHLENDRFWHYLQFYATGRAAQRVLGEDYVPYVAATGLTSREDTKPWYDALEAVWDDHDTLEQRARAAAELLADH